MARNISETLSTAFRSTYSYTHCYHIPGTPADRTVKIMDIPIGTDVFEVPLFAFTSFLEAIDRDDNDVEALIVSLKTNGRSSGYKILERCMKDVLVETFRDTKLAVVEAKDGNDTVLYYGTQGAVFDKGFHPIVMCAWQIERMIKSVANADGSMESMVRYRFIRPILRVSPDVYLRKGDTMERFIVNKIVTGCVGKTVYCPSSPQINKLFSPHPMETVKVEIDSSPYSIHTADTPSISTSSKELLQVAIDHIEEIIQ